MTSIAMWTEQKPSGPSLMDILFSRLDGMYPGMWANKFADAQAIKNWREAWAEAFFEDGITPDEIRVGLGTLRRAGGFPPSLPEFLKACRPPIDYDKSFYEAVQQMGIRRRPKPTVEDGEIKYIFGKDHWSNPAIYWAAVAMGKDLDGEFHKMRSRWHYELDNVLQSGVVRPVPQNTNLIGEPQYSKNLSPEESKNINSILSQIHSMLEEDRPTSTLTPAQQAAEDARLERIKNKF